MLLDIKMTNINDKISPICMNCKAIRIDDESSVWLKREDNPQLYDSIIKTSRGLSHGICPEDEERLMKEEGLTYKK